MTRLILIVLLALVWASPVFAARDSRDVATWLCGNIFEGGGATLAFAEDGFFGLRMELPKNGAHYASGLWRLSPDGVNLALVNQQDAKIKLVVGRDGLHGTLGTLGDISLLPSEKEKAVFQVTGYYEKGANEDSLTDASSGKVFALAPDPKASDGKFAIIQVEIGGGEARALKTLKHSRAVPRFYEHPASKTTSGNFIEDACERFWLLPPFAGAEKTAMRFAKPIENKKSGEYTGSFEVVGRGLRLEGKYRLSGGKLTTSARRDSVRNLEIIGAGDMAKAVIGDYDWRLSARGLELRAGAKRLLLTGMQID